MTVEAMLKALREEGWTVAVHNDYKLNDMPYTFWLFTKEDVNVERGDGRFVKGEGRTDREALVECVQKALGLLL